MLLNILPANIYWWVTCIEHVLGLGNLGQQNKCWGDSDSFGWERQATYQQTKYQQTQMIPESLDKW